MNQIDAAVFATFGQTIEYVGLDGHSIFIPAIKTTQITKARHNGSLIIKRHIRYQLQDFGTYPERGAILTSSTGIKYKIEAIKNFDGSIYTVIVLKLKAKLDFFIDELGDFMVDELGDYMTD